MATVLVRLAGPMQSWGTRSRFVHRDTETVPSKSGVLGLVAAALGRSRTADLADLAGMRLAVRVDRAGHLETDYQTALDVAKADGGGRDTVQSWRHYLADARFLAALEGPPELCEEIQAALMRPRWPLFLGRKGYVPGEPVWCAAGVQDTDALTALGRVEWPLGRDGAPVPELEVEVECGADEDGDARLDVPLSWAVSERRYRERRVRRQTMTHAELEDASGRPT